MPDEHEPAAAPTQTSAPAPDAGTAPSPSAPPATPAAPTDAPALPAQEATGASGEPPAASDDAAAPATETPHPDDIWTQIAAADPDEIMRRHPKLQGKFGRAVQTQAEKRLADERARLEAALTEQITARLAAEQEQARLRELRDSDPYAYVEAQKAQEAQAAEQRQRQQAAIVQEYQRLQALKARLEQGAQPLVAKMPEAVLAKYASKTYDGTPDQGYVAFLNEAIPDSFEHIRAEAYAQGAREAEARLRKELEPAIRKQVLSETNGAETTPDTGGGGAGGGPMTQDEFNQHFAGRPALLRQGGNLARYRAGRQAGLITYDPTG